MKRFHLFLLCLFIIMTAVSWHVMAEEDTYAQQPRLEFNRAHRVGMITFSPDGRFIITYSEFGLREVHIYEAATMRLLRKCSPQQGTSEFALTPDAGDLCFVYNGIKSAHLIDGTITDIDQKTYRRCLAFSPDGKILAVASDDGLSFISYPDGKQLLKTEPIKGKITRGIFSHDGSMIALGTVDSGGRLYVCSLKDGTVTRLGGLFSGHSGNIMDMKFSSDGRLLAAGDSDGKTIIWDHAAQKEIHSFSTEKKVMALHFTGSSSPILIFTGDNRIYTADIASGTMTAPKNLPFPSVSGSFFALSPDGSTFVMTELRDELPMLFRTADFSPLSTMNQMRLKHISSCSVSSDGTVLAFSQHNNIHAINIATGQPLELINQPKDIVSAINCDKMLAVYQQSNEVKLYSMTENKLILQKKLNTDCNAIDISRDGRYIVSASITEDKNNINATRIDTASGITSSIVTKTPENGYSWSINGQRVSDDGRFALFMLSYSRCDLFDFSNGTHEIFEVGDHIITRIGGDGAIYDDPAFKKEMSIAVYNGRITPPKVINMNTGKVNVLRFNKSENCFYTADGKRFLLAFDNGTVQVYDSMTTELLGTIALNGDAFGAIHPDGRYFSSNRDILSLFHWVTGNETVALNDFGQQFFTPGILNEILTGKTAASSAAQKPKPAVVIQRQLIGKVFGFDGSNVIIASTQSGSLVRGGKLFVMPDDGGTIELTVAMPMHTSAKCSIKEQAKKKMIRKGMPVFKN